jgi:hypothetical protein
LALPDSADFENGAGRLVYSPSVRKARTIGDE